MGEAVEHFSYDGVGNRTTDDKTSTNWNYNKNNELQSFDTTSFKYNLNGQMTEKSVNGTKTYYSYNLDGRLKEIKDNSNQIIATYQYDPFGRRLSKTLPKDGNKIIHFHYSNEGLVAEYNEIGELIQSYGYKPDSLYITDPVFTHRPGFSEAKGYAYYINDHLRTPQKLITNTGRKVWEASLDAFGKAIITNNEFINPFRFTGQYRDDESGLNFNYFRYYDPELGRYITSDPIGLVAGLNTYGYVGGNPVRRVDAYGLKFGEGWSKGDPLYNKLQKLCKTPTGKVLCNKIKNSKYTINVGITNDLCNVHTDLSDMDKGGNINIQIHPKYSRDLLLEGEDGDGNKIKIPYSPDRALSHELGHAVNGPVPFYRSKMGWEHDVIDEWENPINNQMHPSSGIRNRTRYMPIYDKQGCTSKKIKTKPHYAQCDQ